jgi:beta-mannosidase
MGTDLLETAAWECCSTPPGAASSPAELEKLPLEWMAAAVPGTAAGAVADRSGRRAAIGTDIDASDWWFRCRIPAGGPGRWRLVFEGLATVADVWFRGGPVLHSENMFVPGAVELEAVSGDDEIVVRFAALAPLLTVRRPRPRWKTQMAGHQALRWFRTTLLGRQPGWAVTPAVVGPWRPVRLEPAGAVRVVGRRVVARCEEDTRGVVSVTLRVTGLAGAPQSGRIRVGRVDAVTSAGEGADAVEGTATVRAVRTEGEGDGGEVVIEGEVTLEGVELWWPWSHGPQPLYGVSLVVGEETVELGRVGFRTVALDRSGGRFALAVNGVEIFCRGACWFPLDPLAPHASDEELRATFELVTGAHMNMVRIPGGTVYEDERFWDLCDERGVMVWQDSMLGYTDPPEDEAFEAGVVAELEEVFGRLGGRPALAVVCGGQEIEEQAAMFGVTREKWGSALIDRVIPGLAGALLPGVPYVSSSPTGGDIPFQPDEGDCHYWGVGSNLRPASDARRSGIRFMSEGMAFAIPPERETVEEECGGAGRAGHDPEWKQALHHDTGRSWDLEDVRDFYVGELFGVDPHLLRYIDPERALDLGRAAVAELYGRTLSEWRRAGSTCRGGLIVAMRDLVPGAGWGLVDSRGRPKAPWFALKRVFAPICLLLTDEGLNGLHLHLVNDSGVDFRGEVTVALFARGELRVEEVGREVEIPGRGQVVVEAGALFDSFRDLAYSFRFGPPAYDVVVAGLWDGAGGLVSEVVHLPSGLDRPLEFDLGLEATARARSDGGWMVTVTTRRFAQWVVVEVPGFRPSDSWFHLAPGSSRTLRLDPYGDGERPAGQVRALNAQTATRLVVE